MGSDSVLIYSLLLRYSGLVHSTWVEVRIDLIITEFWSVGWLVRVDGWITTQVRVTGAEGENFPWACVNFFFFFLKGHT